MKKVLIIVLAVIALSTQAQVTTLQPGENAPEISLKNVDNKQVSFADYPTAKGFIVIFTCNTCPVSKAYEGRVEELNTKYASAGFPVIAVNANDPAMSSAESFAKMQERAKDNKISYPYLYDEGQKFTNQYGAKNTPHVFLISKSEKGNTIEYVGAIDNDTENTNSEKIKYVEQAISSIQNNQKPAVTSTKAIGCVVKRKNQS